MTTRFADCLVVDADAHILEPPDLWERCEGYDSDGMVVMSYWTPTLVAGHFQQQLSVPALSPEEWLAQNISWRSS